MKVFQCGNCHHPLFFESDSCENCGNITGYRDSDQMMLTFDPQNSFLISDREQKHYKYCSNHQYGVCNWVLDITDYNEFCSACQLNRTIPNLSNVKNFARWKSLEIAKHRLVYQLQKIGLTLRSKEMYNDGLCFDFISRMHNEKLMTGHASGVITILLSEADSVIREQMRMQLLEPYRTLIGHLRHEVGHYFWERLVHTNNFVLQEFRTFFGNEQTDYNEALNRYYKNTIPENWNETYISQYATSHPWEDWAETWAHYLHIMDMVETSHFFGLEVTPREVLVGMHTEATFDPYFEPDFDKIIQVSTAVSFAVNNLNRSMGISDLYPFEITPAIICKLKFIHHLLLNKR